MSDILSIILDIGKIVVQLGFPVALCCALIYLLYNLGEKFWASHDKFLKAIQKTLANQAKTLRSIDLNKSKMNEKQDKTNDLLEKQNKLLTDSVKATHSVEKAVKNGT